MRNLSTQSMHSFVLQLCVSVESELHKVLTLTLAAISPDTHTIAQAMNFSQSNPSALYNTLGLGILSYILFITEYIYDISGLLLKFNAMAFFAINNC